MTHIDTTNIHQQSAMIQNYHNNHLDYRSGSQMSFYDNQCTDDDLHRQHYYGGGGGGSSGSGGSSNLVDRQQQNDAIHSSSDASCKSENQIPNIYHQQNGFPMKMKNPTTNNNDCERTIHSDEPASQRKAKQMNHQYGKILNATNKFGSGKEHRNGTRPIPMLPSPPSTPPPPLNAKIKDYHESSNKFYQDYQLNMHLSNQQQNHFNGNANINNNNEVIYLNHPVNTSMQFIIFVSKSILLIENSHSRSRSVSLSLHT